MITMKIWRVAFVMIVAVLSFNSCDQKDGDWESMKWKADIPVKTTDGVYHVKAAGDEFSFSCKNYSSPWIDHAVSNGEYYYPPREANDYHTISADWFKVAISGNKLTVVFDANETVEERPLLLTVTAGDIFYTFKFMQLANDENGIAYTPFYYYDTIVNDERTQVIGVNGIVPSKQTIEDDSYPYETHVMASVRADIDKSSTTYQLFYQLATGQHKDIVKESGYIVYQ